MSLGPFERVLGNLRRIAFQQGAVELTDGELLERYVARRDDDAFAGLVQRHGPMVLGVCRRILANAQDTEDAFQATFLVLACKAASIVPREMVGSWLYGAACLAAQKARAVACRRRARERQVSPMPEPATVAEGLWHDLEPLLDRELAGLPDKYRLPIVLCDLEAKTRKEAARQLGWPEGTVAGRLARGRAMLARRLTRHGLPCSGGVLAAVLAEQAEGEVVPAPLMAATVKIGARVAAGKAVVGRIVSESVAAIAAGVMKAMLLSKLKILVPLFLCLVLAGIGASMLAHQALAIGKAPPAKPEAPRKAAALQPARKDTLVLQNLFVESVDPTQRTVSVSTRRNNVAIRAELRQVGPGKFRVSNMKLRLQHETKLQGLPLAKTGRVVINHQPGRLADLKVGMRVKLELGGNGEDMVVRVIEVIERKGGSP
jgi:RNA polymerase sigma factor (sigma-70 family)